MVFLKSRDLEDELGDRDQCCLQAETRGRETCAEGLSLIGPLPISF